MCRDCSCWEDGYDEGQRDALKKTNGVPPGISEQEVEQALRNAARVLYSTNPLSIIALDCEQLADAIHDHTPREQMVA